MLQYVSISASQVTITEEVSDLLLASRLFTQLVTLELILCTLLSLKDHSILCMPFSM